MLLSDVSISRPVMAFMMTLALIVFGAIGYVRLPIREMPDIDFPTATVTVPYPGAAPEVVEEEVADPLEEVINTIQGIKSLKSTSTEGGVNITITFELDQDIDVATQEVRDKIALVRRDLPDEIEEPVVQKLASNRAWRTSRAWGKSCWAESRSLRKGSGSIPPSSRPTK
jgi:multidrug efflux pump